MSLAVDNAVILRGSDSILQGGWDGCTTTADIMLNACGSSHTPAYGPTELIQLLGESNQTIAIRAEVGRELQVYSNLTWKAATPNTEYGPLLITKMDIVEDVEARGGWRIRVTSEGMGRISNGGGSSPHVYPDRGAALIRLNVSHRNRTARAWRVPGAKGNSDPALSYVTDVLDHDEFTREPWHTGTDIGGQKVDMNSVPQPYRIPQKVIQIDIVRRGQYHSWAETSDTYKNPVYTLDGAADGKKWPGSEIETLPPIKEPEGTYVTGSRNRVGFLGFGIGELLLDSVTVSTIRDIGNFKQISYVLIAEPLWKHADQMPLVISEAGPFGATTKDTVTDMRQMSTVFWNQTYFSGWETDSTDWTPEEWDYLNAMSV